MLHARQTSSYDHNYGHYRNTMQVSLYLSGSMADGKETLEASYRFYLIGETGGKISSIHRGNHKFGSNGYYSCDEMGFSNDQAKKALQADGSLVVAVDIEFLAPDDGSAMAVSESALFSKWHDTVGKLRKSGDFSDCTLMVGGEELKAHRLILSAISPIFGKMFSRQAYQEARDGIVRIEDPAGMLKDSTAKPYKALLSYAYAGCVDWTIFGDCKGDVLVVACKYLVLDLKHHVEGLLAREITTESYIELAVLGDTYSCDQLKRACHQFLCSHCLAVVLTPQWDVLMKTRVDLASELLRLVREAKTTADGGTK